MNSESKAAIKAAQNLNAIILAGGKSSRFGRDKAALEIGGKRILQTLITVLRHFPFQKIVLVTNGSKKFSSPQGVEFLRDDQDGLGPIGGIVTALRRLPHGVFVAACDMPLVSVGFVQWLLSENDSQINATIPRSLNGVEPLLGIYLKSFLPVMEKAIREGGYALHRVLAKGRVRYVDVPAPFERRHELANINTPSDYEWIEKLGQQRSEES